MKKYHVYSIGTALVDLQYKLDHQIDLGINLELSGTNVINAQEEEQLLKKLSGMKAIQSCGGSCGNTLSVVRGLGGNVFCTSKVGQDAAGDYFHQNLRENGIETSLDSAERAESRTGKCIIILLPDAERVLNSFMGANACVSLNDINKAALENSQYLFIESFLSVLPQPKETILAAQKIARAAGCKIALTFTTCRSPEITRDDLNAMVGDGVDLLFCNEFEAKFFCHSHDMAEVTEKLKQVSRQFVITLGSRGALLYDGKKLHEVAGHPAVAIDTTGAGDAFAGAFLYAITHGASFPVAGDIACFSAAKMVMQYGARLEKSVIDDVARYVKSSPLNVQPKITLQNARILF